MANLRGGYLTVPVHYGGHGCKVSSLASGKSDVVHTTAEEMQSGTVGFQGCAWAQT